MKTGAYIIFTPLGIQGLVEWNKQEDSHTFGVREKDVKGLIVSARKKLQDDYENPILVCL